ncbi:MULTISPECIES: DUF4468 domain-containing protein [unclassified Chryseobacterium]|uniref:DUF4468 domain-containing protein n=1 Tax=unclassified Chryseobacterium TaxID=2593645 RepID=UPI0030178F1F
MKKLFSTFILFLAVTLNSQIKVTAAPEELMLSENVIKIDSLTSDQIYKNSIKWVNRTFKNPDIVLKSQIPGELVRIHSVWKIPSKGVFGNTILQLSYSMQVDIKDGRVRITVNDLKGVDRFVYSACFRGSGEKRQTNESQRFFNDIETYTADFLNNFIESLKGKKEEW